MKNRAVFFALMTFAQFHEVICDKKREDNFKRSKWGLEDEQLHVTGCCTTDESKNWTVSIKDTELSNVSNMMASANDGPETRKPAAQDSHQRTVVPSDEHHTEVRETTRASQTISGLVKGSNISNPSPEQKDSKKLTTQANFATKGDDISQEISTSLTAILVENVTEFITFSPTKPDPATPKIRDGKETEKSCRQHCDKSKKQGCDCDSQCFVYKTCCQDIAEFCPHVQKNAAALFGPFLMGVTPRCGERSGMLTIDKCPDGWKQSNNINNGAHQDTPAEGRASVSEFFENIRDQMNVFDRHTGLIFENMTVYNCNAKNESFPDLFQAVLEADENTEAASPLQLMELLKKSENIVSIPRNYEATIRACGEESWRAPPFQFAVVMDFSIPDKISVSPYGPRAIRFIFWKQTTCNESSSGPCEQTSCSHGVIIAGKCTMVQYLRFILAHPPFKLFHRAEVKEFAEFLKCALDIARKNRRVYVDGMEVITNIDGIKLIGQGNLLFPPDAMSPKWTYFRIDLNTTFSDRAAFVTHSDLGIMLDALYRETGLVSVNERRFPVWISDTRTETLDQDSITLPTVMTEPEEAPMTEDQRRTASRVTGCYRAQEEPFGAENSGVRCQLMFWTPPPVTSERFTACSLIKGPNGTHRVGRGFVTTVIIFSLAFTFLF